MLLLAASQAIAYIDRVNLSVAGPEELVKVQGYTPTELGFLLSVFNWAFTASLLLAGPFADWARPRLSFPLGVGAWSLATALCSVTTAFVPLALFRAFVGIGEVFDDPVGRARDPRDLRREASRTRGGHLLRRQQGGPHARHPAVRSAVAQLGLAGGVLHHRRTRRCCGSYGGLSVYRAPPREAGDTGHRDRHDPLAASLTVSHHLGRDARTGGLSVHLLRVRNLAAGLSHARAQHVGPQHRHRRHASVPDRHGRCGVRRLGGGSHDPVRLARDDCAQRVRGGRTSGRDRVHDRGRLRDGHGDGRGIAHVVGREREPLHRIGEFDADRCGAAAYRLIAHVAPEFRRQCRRLIRAHRHRCCW